MYPDMEVCGRSLKIKNPKFKPGLLSSTNFRTRFYLERYSTIRGSHRPYYPRKALFRLRHVFVFFITKARLSGYSSVVPTRMSWGLLRAFPTGI